MKKIIEYAIGILFLLAFLADGIMGVICVIDGAVQHDKWKFLSGVLMLLIILILYISTIINDQHSDF